MFDLVDGDHHLGEVYLGGRFAEIRHQGGPNGLLLGEDVVIQLFQLLQAFFPGNKRLLAPGLQLQVKKAVDFRGRGSLNGAHKLF